MTPVATVDRDDPAHAGQAVFNHPAGSRPTNAEPPC